jgi:hypothetical protein
MERHQLSGGDINAKMRCNTALPWLQVHSRVVYVITQCIAQFMVCGKAEGDARHHASCHWLQVTSKLCNACNLIASGVLRLPKSDANLVVCGVVEKMADTKVKTHAGELLTTLAEVCFGLEIPCALQSVLQDGEPCTSAACPHYADCVRCVS